MALTYVYRHKSQTDHVENPYDCAALSVVIVSPALDECGGAKDTKLCDRNVNLRKK